MEEVKDFFGTIKPAQVVNSIVIIIFSIAIYKLIVYFLTKGEKRNKQHLVNGKKRATYFKLTRSLLRYTFIIVTILLLLQINGIDVSSVLAGVGILGVVFGLAIQDWLKDIIRGSSILTDNYFSVGDIVKYKEKEGKVIVIGLKTTKIQDLKTNNIISIANRNIEEVELVSNVIYINIPMPYEVNVEEAEKVIEDIIKNINANDNTEECKYKGVNELADSSVKYLIEVKCNPLYKLQVRRDAQRTILLGMKKHNIDVPYTQIDIHEKS